MGNRQTRGQSKTDKVYNKKTHKRRKIYFGLQLGKNPDSGGLGVEGNVQFAHVFDKDTKYESVEDPDKQIEIENTPAIEE